MKKTLSVIRSEPLSSAPFKTKVSLSVKRWEMYGKIVLSSSNFSNENLIGEFSLEKLDFSVEYNGPHCSKIVLSSYNLSNENQLLYNSQRFTLRLTLQLNGSADRGSDLMTDKFFSFFFYKKSSFLILMTNLYQITG